MSGGLICELWRAAAAGCAVAFAAAAGGGSDGVAGGGGVVDGRPARINRTGSDHSFASRVISSGRG